MKISVVYLVLFLVSFSALAQNKNEQLPFYEIPFWNNINGPIADAIWHCGQIASFRRSSGNPINPNINHFNGAIKQ